MAHKHRPARNRPIFHIRRTTLHGAKMPSFTPSSGFTIRLLTFTSGSEFSGLPIAGAGQSVTTALAAVTATGLHPLRRGRTEHGELA